MASPLSLFDDGPNTFAHMSGYVWLPWTIEASSGLFPNWLIGLPMWAGASYSPTACLATSVWPAPTIAPNMFLTVRRMVTLSCVGRSPALVDTVTPFCPSV